MASFFNDIRAEWRQSMAAPKGARGNSKVVLGALSAMAFGPFIMAIGYAVLNEGGTGVSNNSAPVAINYTKATVINIPPTNTIFPADKEPVRSLENIMPVPAVTLAPSEVNETPKEPVPVVHVAPAPVSVARPAAAATSGKIIPVPRHNKKHARRIMRRAAICAAPVLSLAEKLKTLFRSAQAAVSCTAQPTRREATNYNVRNDESPYAN